MAKPRDLVGEVGLGTVKDGKTAAQDGGMGAANTGANTIHTGGPSIPGSGDPTRPICLETGQMSWAHQGGPLRPARRPDHLLAKGAKPRSRLCHNGK